MTNKRSLIEPALLRPGRFEVQIEVPKPKSVTQRVSILNVHTKNMFQAGRVLVRDAPKETAASRRISVSILFPFLPIFISFEWMYSPKKLSIIITFLPS